MKKGIMAVMAIIFIFGFNGCVSYNHTQAVRNETGFTIKEVYIRDTGSNDWGNVRNVEARTDSEGKVIRYSDGSVAYWDRTDMNHATQIVFFYGGNSETPRTTGNKDIAMKDSNGLLYMKNNVPITFKTTKYKHWFDFQGETLTASAPITFTAKDRLPMLFVENKTGYPVTLIAPVKNSISNNGRTQFQPMEMNRSIDVIYSIGQVQYTEQVTMKNEDASVTLTKRPPYVTIQNNTGSTVNIVFIRTPNTAWAGPNVLNLQLNADGTLAQAQAGVQTNELRGSITNRESFRFWTGNVQLSGNVFDIRIDDVQNNAYQKMNVQIDRDMTLTFTQADKR
ncbi:hypothetical protein [Treponema sp. R6D11]